MRDDLFDARGVDDCFDVPFHVIERVAWLVELLLCLLGSVGLHIMCQPRSWRWKIHHGGIGFGVLG
jgi:hypothetical protein